MKKQLLSIFAAIAVSTSVAQTVTAADWSLEQHAAFPIPSAGVRYIDAVSPSVVWLTGYNGADATENYVWASRTTDGGNTFSCNPVFPDPNDPTVGDTNDYRIANIEGIDGNTAWVSAYQVSGPYLGNPGGGVILRTTNSGQTWNNMTATGMFTDVATSFANFVIFLTPSVGIANGDPVNGEFEIWRTTNGGLSWNQTSGANIPDPMTGEFAIVNLYAKVGTSNIWYGTNTGRIYYTTDAGLTWSVSTVAASTSTVIDIAFTTPNNGIATVFSNQLDFFNTVNGGQTWNQIFPSGQVGGNDICGVPGTNSLVSVANDPTNLANCFISYSTDNGNSWNNYGGQNIGYLAVDFADPTNGWAGSFANPTVNPVSTLSKGIFKYTGGTSGTVAPTAGFSMPSYLCLTGPSATATVFNSSAGSPTLVYSWSAAPAGVSFSSPSATTPVLTFTAPNVYTITLMVTNSAGTNTTSQVITVQACSSSTANFTSAPGPVCTNIPFNLTNTSIGGSPAPSYSWSSIPPNAVSFIPSPVVLSPSMVVNTAGSFTIVLEATNNQGVATKTASYTANACLPMVTFTAPEVWYSNGNKCKEGTTLLPSSTETAIPGAVTSYTWKTSPTTGVSFVNPGANVLSPKINFAISGTAPYERTYTVVFVAANQSGSVQVTQTLTVKYLDCVGIDENSSLSTNMVVYPNPAHEQVNLLLPANSGSYNVKLISVLGAVVYSESTAKENVAISLANKPKGVYFLTVESTNEKVTKKIIIE